MGKYHSFCLQYCEEQPSDGSKAKPYQVRQVRTVLVRYKLEVED